MCGQHQHDTTTGSTDATGSTEATGIAVEPAPQAEATASCCGHAAPAAAAAEDDTAICPVMAGTAVSKAAAEAAGLYRDYHGTRYWFCCAACGPLWDADPAKYALA